MPNLRLRRFLPRSLRRFADDERGTSMIEFAMIMPALLATMAGTHAAGSLFSTATQVSKTSAVVGDIISRTPATTGDSLQAVFDAAEIVIGPDLRSDLQLYAAGVQVVWDSGSNKNITEVLWVRDNRRLKGVMCADRPKIGQQLKHFDVPPQILQQTGQFFVYTRVRHEQALPVAAEIIKLGDGGTYNHDYEHIYLTRDALSTDCPDCNKPPTC